MSWIVKNEDAERLPGQVDAEVGESLTEAILRRLDTLPNLDSRPESESLGYGEDGIPR